MAAPTNTETTLTAKGLREDLSNLIFRVAAEQTPFISNIGRAKASGIYHEWQTETLANPSATNAALEGGDVGTLGAPNRTSRVGNRCQIYTKDGGVSGTMEAVNKAGRASELARQKLLKGKEASRDLEMRALGNYASRAEASSNPRWMGGALAWVETNAMRGAGGSDGGFDGTSTVDAFTSGTARTWTEDLLKSAMALAFAEGATPSQAYMSGTHKQQASAFTGIADIRVDGGNGKKSAAILGSADFYQSDFGLISFIPHAYAMSAHVLIADPDMFALATLRPWNTQKLAVSGDSEKFQLIGEFTLECKNEKAHASVCDLS